MNTIDIDSALCSHPVTRQHFLGTFPADRLPRYVVPRPAILVANSDRHGKPGAHWLGFVLPSHVSKSTCEYFDSFGMTPFLKDFDLFIHRNAEVCIFNDVAVQDPLSDSCGKFVCIFLLLRCMGYTFKAIKGLFSNSTQKNEALVSQLYDYHFGRIGAPCLQGITSDRCVAFLQRQ